MIITLQWSNKLVDPPVGDGRQVPQKPPRGTTTRGPPQLVIPPPPPYPPPDRDIMDPSVCYREADVTAPTELVPESMFEKICICISTPLMVTLRGSFSRLSSLLSRHACLFFPLFSGLLSFKMPNAV